MKTIVVYQSANGSTKKYAEWIGQELKADIAELKSVGNKDLSGYDQVIFGGWIFGGHISGFNKFRKKEVKQLKVFAVGLSPRTEKYIDTFREVNQLGDTPFFYFPGAMKYSSQNFIKKQMLKMVSKQTLKNPQSTKEELEMANKMLTDFDATDIRYIKPLVDSCQ